jgi:hypothetical protein
VVGFGADADGQLCHQRQQEPLDAVAVVAEEAGNLQQHLTVHSAPKLARRPGRLLLAGAVRLDDARDGGDEQVEDGLPFGRSCR